MKLFLVCTTNEFYDAELISKLMKPSIFDHKFEVSEMKVDGLPDGCEFVRVGVPQPGEFYYDSIQNTVHQCSVPHYRKTARIIVDRKPTRKHVLHGGPVKEPEDDPNYEIDPPS